MEDAKHEAANGTNSKEFKGSTMVLIVNKRLDRGSLRSVWYSTLRNFDLTSSIDEHSKSFLSVSKQSTSSLDGKILQFVRRTSFSDFSFEKVKFKDFLKYFSKPGTGA